jgi:hypothetical protein
MLTSGSNESEILWNFGRYSPGTRQRITLAENPHFYHHHSPNAYGHGFTTDPIEDYKYTNDIYVLTNSHSRIFFEIGEGSRAFDNVWRTNDIFIFRSQCPVFFYFLLPANTFQASVESSRVNI